MLLLQIDLKVRDGQRPWEQAPVGLGHYLLAVTAVLAEQSVSQAASLAGFKLVQEHGPPSLTFHPLPPQHQAKNHTQRWRLSLQRKHTMYEGIVPPLCA